MLEATPGRPWGIGFKDLLDVEQDMKLRFVGHEAPKREMILTPCEGEE
jgi:hypothetical protein